VDGSLRGYKNIGEHCDEGDIIAMINEQAVTSPFGGVMRGLLRSGLHVTRGLKIGDVDARGDVSACFLVSDKSLAIGGGVLEAILSRRETRSDIYSD
jgi:xanthine dehydrogenase accessory factor